MKKQFFLVGIILGLIMTPFVLISQASSGRNPAYNFVKTKGVTEVGDSIGILRFRGLNVSGKTLEGAAIRAFASQEIKGSIIPTSLIFVTGTDQLTQQMIINEHGYIGINTDAPGARLSIRQFSEGDGLKTPIFNVLGGRETEPRQFSLYTENNTNVLNAFLDGNMTIEGNQLLKKGHLTLNTGNILVDKGYLKLTKGDAIIKEGKLVVENGGIKFGKGDIHLKEGSQFIDKGNLTITEGYMLMNQGNLTLKEGHMVMDKGKMFLGTKIRGGNHKLFVNGSILTTEVKIAYLTNWPDYVFNPDYSLMPLSAVEEFIKNNNHLPGVPSAEEVKENGIEVAATQALLLEKIEELTLHLIEQEKQIEAMKVKITEQEKTLEVLNQKHNN